MLALSRLNWIQRITIILFVTVVANWLMSIATGYSLLGGDLFTILFILFLVLLTLTLMRPLMRSVLWRVRNRLFVTYFLIGALPALLMVIILAFLTSVYSGAIAAYVVQSELNRRIDELQQRAQQLADDIEAGRRKFLVAEFPVQTVVRMRNRTVASEGAIQAIPSWSQPGFKGIVRTNAPLYFLSALAQSAGPAEMRVEVFAYSPFDDKAAAAMAVGFGRVQVFRFRDVGREDIQDVRPILDSLKADRSADTLLTAFGGFPLTNVRLVDSGRADDHGVSVTTNPVVVADRMLSGTLGSMKSIAIIGILTVLAGLLAVELVAIASSVKLTRTLTRTIHDLHIGTQKIEGGDFSHRIPIRTKDQLSELATSFNHMTQRVEQLLAEVKEKEKLEAELEIARHVQAQLFPKEVPKLQTMELIGVCKPARVVSGDYYDFIPIGSRSTALVIGDISGKGISAALLMASVQSALHAQLTMAANGNLSTATLVSRLNRQLYQSTPPEKYATFYCGLYDDQSGILAYTNAGHLAPILIRNRDVIRLESNGMVVGMFPESLYEQNVVQLQSGDLLTAFTDGITECENHQGEQFGEERLTDLLLRHRERPLDEILSAITDVLRDWASDIDNQDDTTILIARRL